MTHNPNLAAKLYRSNANAMRAGLPDLGESLRTAAIELANDCTLARVNEMLARAS